MVIDEIGMNFSTISHPSRQIPPSPILFSKSQREGKKVNYTLINNTAHVFESERFCDVISEAVLFELCHYRIIGISR